ncbi:MAG: hypothetical protein PWP65_1476 [Clostridia bacterium]|nr:hypothetical protein [Clostridia bacterium]
MKLGAKLTITLAVIAVIATIVTTILATRAVHSSFDLYVQRNYRYRLEQLRDAVISYYARNGWTDIQSFLLTPVGKRRGGIGAGIGRFSNERILIIDAQGRVVADTWQADLGQTLNPGDKNYTLPVIVNGQQVGTIVTEKLRHGLLEEEFIRSVNKANLTAGGIALALAFILGLIITRQLSTPLANLATAARRISSGDLAYRVPVTSSDEIGDLARSFNQMAGNLERNEKLRRNMIADLAHELRTPLAILRGNLESLQEGVIEPSTEVIVSLHDEVLRLSRLVADLQELALVEAGELKLRLAPVSPGDFFKKITQGFRLEAAARGLGFELKMPADLPQVRIDPDRIAQVVHNLLLNALRHTPPGGFIALKVRRLENHLEVSVVDNGPGIPAEDLPHIFDRFYRSKAARHQNGSGAGLGLAIAKGLVEAHGGRIWAESKEGEGSKFTFTIPVIA